MRFKDIVAVGLTLVALEAMHSIFPVGTLVGVGIVLVLLFTMFWLEGKPE